MSSNSSILIYGNDATLLNTRRWVLESAGFEVSTVSSMASAEDAISCQPLDVFILCYSLSPEQRRDALLAAAGLRPQMRNLSMCTTYGTGGDDLMEASLDAFSGPYGLIAAVRKILRTNSAS